MAQKLIITCDDCGLSEGINNATLALHQKRMASAASIITNFPAAYHAYSLFAEYPTLECGVHLNLTEGIPLTKIASPSPLTCADGHFKSRMALFRQALRPTATFTQLVTAELTAQVQHFLELGLPAHHLTTHIHFHGVPALRAIVVGLAEKFDIEWIRAHRLDSSVLPFNPLLHRGTSQASPKSALPTRELNYLMPVLFWLRASPETFSERLKSLEGTVEIVVHSSLPDDKSFPPGVGYLPAERFREVQYLEKVMRLTESGNAM